MTPDHTTSKSHDSDRDRPRQRRQSDGHHHRGTAAKSPENASAQSQRHAADQEDRKQEDSSPDHRQQDSGDDRDQDSSGNGSKRRTAAWAIAAVRSQFPELSGRSLEHVTGVDKGDDSTWTVGVEVVEMRMVPDTADVLAQYEVQVDQDGDIVGYKRKRRYLRGRADD